MNALARKSMGTQHADSVIRTRVAAQADRDFVISLAPRLVASGLPPWRHPRRMLAAYVEVIDSILRSDAAQHHAPRTGAALLLAEDGDATLLGFVLLVAATDCYTHERCGHVAQIVVAHSEHELSVGMALIAAAEAWTRSRGYRVLTLSEFWANHPASAVRVMRTNA